jgi:DNA-binding PadR family transcriptional regulator
VAPAAIGPARLATLPPVLSSLSYAILALLATKPQSGYDIARQMKPPLGFLWQARHGQIYPELARLVEEGLVDLERLDPRGGPPRRVHAITPAGRTELSRWVAKPPQPRSMNDELVVKAFALRKANVATAIGLLNDQIKLHEQRLAALEQRSAAIESRDGGAPDPGSSRFGEFAALRRGIGAERDYLAWCRWLRSQLDPSRALTAWEKGRRPATRTGARRVR